MSAQQTLLQLTQNILSGLTSDEVNSISDTVESMQVATIIKNKYYDIVTRAGLTKNKQLVQLTASNSLSLPTLMYVPANVSDIEWIKYFDSNPTDGASSTDTFDHDLNTDIVSTPTWATTSTTSNTIQIGTATFTVSSGLVISVGSGFIASSGTNELIGTVTSYSGTTLVVNATEKIGSGTYSSWNIVQDNGATAPPGYKYVTILPFQQFIDMINMFNPSNSDVGSFTFADTLNSFNGNYTFYYKNDHTPQYCTILSNYYVVFDAYDSTQDDTLESSKTMVYGEIIPAFTMTDSFIPDLDPEQFPLLLNEAKALAFFELKQMIHPKAEMEIKRQWSSVQKDKSIDNKPSYFDQLANFGRK